MAQPIDVQIPHRLGREEAKRRIAANIGKLQRHLPGPAEVRSAWAGDRLDMQVKMLGQQVAASMRVEETVVHCRIDLPDFLSFVAAPVEAMLRRVGPELLEDHRPRP